VEEVTGTRQRIEVGVEDTVAKGVEHRALPLGILRHSRTASPAKMLAYFGVSHLGNFVGIFWKKPSIYSATRPLLALMKAPAAGHGLESTAGCIIADHGEDGQENCSKIAGKLQGIFR
jgi:hypothetical protein